MVTTNGVKLQAIPKEDQVKRSTAMGKLLGRLNPEMTSSIPSNNCREHCQIHRNQTWRISSIFSSMSTRLGISPLSWIRKYQLETLTSSYPGSDCQLLSCYSDSDCAGCQKTRRSTDRQEILTFRFRQASPSLRRTFAPPRRGSEESDSQDSTANSFREDPVWGRQTFVGW